MSGAFFGVSVAVDTHVLDGLIGSSTPVAEQVLKIAALEFDTTAKMHAPIDTSALRNSINTQGGGLAYTVSDGVGYGVYQEFGVNHPYTIDSPVNIKGRWVYIKQHPGFKAQPFFTPAAEKVSSHYFVEFFPIWLAGA